MKVRKILHFEFSQDLVKEPLLYQLTKQFDVETNIRGAQVTDEGGYVVLEVRGDAEVVQSVMDYLTSTGVEVSEKEEEEG